MNWYAFPLCLFFLVVGTGDEIKVKGGKKREISSIMDKNNESRLKKMLNGGFLYIFNNGIKIALWENVY